MAPGLTGEPPADVPVPVTPALELRDITMRFGTFQALKHVDFLVNPGEIVGLVGENGSGKSTLVKVLAGVNAPEPGGALRLGGRQVPLPLLPGQFRDLGLSFVHQDLGLGRTLSVVENLIVGERGGDHSRRPINWRAELRRVRKVLDSYGVRVDPRLAINRLPPVGQALVAIVRAAEELKAYRQRDAAAHSHSILFLDEPTVFLPEAEVEFLFDLVRNVVRDGASAVFISHDLSAVRTLCDRAVVLRDGEVAGQAAMHEIDDQDLVDLIVGPAGGRTVDRTHRRANGADAGDPSELPVRCEVANLTGGRVRDVGFSLPGTEIVGVTGLLGSGAEDLAYLLFGAQRCERGTAAIDGRRIQLRSMTPAEAVRRNIALVPADRRRDAIAPTLTVAENTTILVNHRYTTFGRIRLRRLATRVRALLEKFDVRPRKPNVQIGQLSGGNQQKVVLAKWLEIQPKVLLLHEPTQGVDVAARAEIYRLVRRATEEGMATLWVSSDVEELATVCDRVLIMADGAIRTELSGAELTEEKISSAVYYYSTDAAVMLGGVD